jgi:YfiH family protein
LELEGVRADGTTRWQDLANALDIELDSLVRMRQVHGAGVFERGRERDSRLASGPYDDWPEADIAVSNAPAIAVSVRAADCVPILLADRRTGAVAAIHAGWKGTAAGAAMVAVRSLTSRFGTNPEDLIAAIGPSIGPCCYEVGPDLTGHFASHAQSSEWFTRDAKPHLDLWRATIDQLAGAGVPPPQIHLCALCTFDHPALFDSYRRDGSHAGRLVAAIRSAPDRTP